MKKIICIIICLLIPVCVVAESVDLSSLSFDDLRVLQTRISKELITRPEWKSVPVPPGMYLVGRDIPAGEWTITCGDSMFNYVSVECGYETNETGTRIKAGKGRQFGELICQPGTSEGKNPESITVVFSEGQYIRIEYGQAVFSIPERVDLGF